MTRQEQAKIVDKILALPRRKRWQGAVKFYLAMNPSKIRENQEAIKRVGYLKNQAEKDSAVSVGGRMRLAVSMPPSVLEAIKLFDPEFLEGDLVQNKKDLQEFRRVFPQYSVPRSSM